VDLALGELELHDQRLGATAAGSGLGRGGPDPAHVRVPDLGGPDAVVVEREALGRVRAVLRAQVEHHVDLRPAPHREDPAQDDGPIGTARQRQRLATFDRAVVGDPPAAPDQARLVVAAPDVASLGGHPVHPLASDQGGQAGVRIPARKAHPGVVAARTDEDSPLAVGQQRVLAQYVRRAHAGQCARGRVTHRSQTAQLDASVTQPTGSGRVGSTALGVTLSWRSGPAAGRDARGRRPRTRGLRGAPAG